MNLSNTLASLQMLQRIHIPQIIRYVEIFSVLLGNFKHNEQYPYLNVPAAEYNVNFIWRACNMVKCLQVIFWGNRFGHISETDFHLQNWTKMLLLWKLRLLPIIKKFARMGNLCFVEPLLF
jgi:hypothetical protein